LSATIPQDILDALTDIAMPRLTTERPAKEAVLCGASQFPFIAAKLLSWGAAPPGYGRRSR
jgi:hypothetical protein